MELSLLMMVYLFQPLFIWLGIYLYMRDREPLDRQVRFDQYVKGSEIAQGNGEIPLDRAG